MRLARFIAHLRANIAELAEILDITRPTVSAWVDDGMPSLVKGSKGIPWVFDVKQCIDWYAENRFRRTKHHPGLNPFDETDGPESMEAAERRKMVANADKAELELAKSARLVVPIEEVARTTAEEHARVRSKLLAIPNDVRMRVRSYFGGDRELEEKIIGGVEQSIFDAMADIREPVEAEERVVDDEAPA